MPMPPELETRKEATSFGQSPSDKHIHWKTHLYEIREDINAILSNLRQGLVVDLQEILTPALERQALLLQRNEALLERLQLPGGITSHASGVALAPQEVPAANAFAVAQSHEEPSVVTKNDRSNLRISNFSQACISDGPSARDTHEQDYRCSRRCRQSRMNSPLQSPHSNLAVGVVEPGNVLKPNVEAAFKVGNVDAEEYNVLNFYKDTGWPQAVARNGTFGNITLGMIAANAIYIGIDINNNTAKTFEDAALPYQICEQMFAFFFMFEWTVRFASFANKANCLKDMWFKFDSCLVVLLVTESWLVPILVAILSSQRGGFEFSIGPLGLLRMLRLARLTRLMRALPELAIMVKGIFIAARAVGSSMLMLVLIVYIFAIMMFALVGEEEHVQEWFRSVPLSMWTLILDGVFMDSLAVVLDALLEIQSFHTICLFAIFVILSAITILNMLIGVLCEVVSAVGEASNEEMAISMVKRTVLVMLKALDEDQSGFISKEEFFQVVHDPGAVAVLEDLNVDIDHLVELQEMLYKKPGSALTIAQVMDLILAARGDRPATVQDVIDQTTFIRFTILSTFGEWKRVIADAAEGGNRHSAGIASLS